MEQEVINYKFTPAERMIIMQVVPQTMDVATAKQIIKIKKKVDFTKAEQERYNITYSGSTLVSMKFLPYNTDEEIIEQTRVEIGFSKYDIKFIMKMLKIFDDKSSIPAAHADAFVSVWDIFHKLYNEHCVPKSEVEFTVEKEEAKEE